MGYRASDQSRMNKELEECYQRRREEELQKTEKVLTRKAEKAMYKYINIEKQDKETSNNTILRFNICEDEGTGLENVIKNIGVDKYKGNIIGEE